MFIIIDVEGLQVVVGTELVMWTLCMLRELELVGINFLRMLDTYGSECDRPVD